VAVFACIILVMGMAASLWEHWARVKEPTTAIAVVGDASLDGAKVIVEGADEETQRQPKVEVALSVDHKYQQAIYRYPGRYHITVMSPIPELGKIAETDLTIDRFRGAQVDLPTTVTIICTPGDRITLANEMGGSQRFEPNDTNHYRVVLFLSPGKYHMTRTHGGAVISPDEEFVITAHTPKELTLPHIP